MFYKLMFALTEHNILTVSESENLYPFELDIYTYQLINKINKKNEQLRKSNAK